MTVLNVWFPAGLESILDGSIVATSDTLMLQLVDNLYVYDATDVTLNDVAGARRLGTLTTLAGTRTAVGRTLCTDTALTTFVSVAVDADEVGGVILCVDGATDSDRTLMHLWQRSGDVEIVVVSDGGDIDVEFVEETDTGQFGVVRI